MKKVDIEVRNIYRFGWMAAFYWDDPNKTVSHVYSKYKLVLLVKIAYALCVAIK